MKDFWLTSKSPKEIYSEFILPENPNASLWDIFTDYSLIFPEIVPADTSLDWMATKEKSIASILNNELKGKVLSRMEIEDLCMAIEEFIFSEGEPLLDYIDAKLIPVAEKIAKTYMLPKAINQATVNNFVDELQERLEKHNAEHIAKTDKDAMRKMMLDIPYYSDAKKQEIIDNLERTWEMNPEVIGMLEESFDEDFDEESNDYESEGYWWPEINLANSQTFYGIDDAGNLSYEEQEKLAEEKYNAFVTEISELLGAEPNADLAPNSLQIEDENWEKFDVLAEQHPLINEFELHFSVWRGDDNVLFLTMRKEDKALPYQIVLGGMELHEYQDVLKAYNSLGKNT